MPSHFCVAITNCEPPVPHWAETDPGVVRALDVPGARRPSLGPQWPGTLASRCSRSAVLRTRLFGVPNFSERRAGAYPGGSSRGRSPRRAAAALAAVAAATALLAGCASAPGGDGVGHVGAAAPVVADDRPVVLTTFTVLADIARNVAGDHLRIESITKIGAEIHGYEPTPGDIRRAADADLVLDNGLGLEAWFARFVDGLDVPHVVVSDGVGALPIVDRDGEPTGHANPHAWMSTVNAAVYVDNMVDAFTALDPEHAADYAANGAAYTAEIRAVQDGLTAELAALSPQHRALVTCEGAFSYLARDAGLTEEYLWAVNAEQQATPRQVAGVIDAVREADVPAVFCESTVSDKAMLQVVASSDAVFGGVLYVDSLSAPGGPVPTYLDLLRHDAQVVIDGLTGRTGTADAAS